MEAIKLEFESIYFDLYELNSGIFALSFFIRHFQQL